MQTRRSDPRRAGAPVPPILRYDVLRRIGTGEGDVVDLVVGYVLQVGVDILLRSDADEDLLVVRGRPAKPHLCKPAVVEHLVGHVRDLDPPTVRA